jgi:hypothetical protein
MSQGIDLSRERLVEAVYKFTVAAATQDQVEMEKHTKELEAAASSADSAVIKSVVGKYGPVTFEEAANKVKSLVSAVKDVRDLAVRMGR